MSMPITEYFDGTAVRVNRQLQMNQRVIVIPIENEETLMDTATGELHKYADPSMIGLEKDVWREAVVKKHVQKYSYSDANAVLRFLLQDLEEQLQEMRAVVKSPLLCNA